MAWKENKVEDQRKKFIAACLEGNFTMAELCRMYEISRKSGYKWLNRYKDKGLDGLKDRSRAPHHQTLKLSDNIISEIFKVKYMHPWGPKKVLGHLKRAQPDVSWPSITAVRNLFDRNGLTTKQKHRRRLPARTSPLSHCQFSNDVWCADFKGRFLTLDGNKCEPFTLTDASSRYLLRCLMLERNDFEHVWAVLETAFHEYGLPLFFRTDNGSPFATIGAGRLSKLAINLIKVGITPEWIDPGKPQQNGRHERMHQTLKNETANPPEHILEKQAKKFDEFRNYFNNIRPHEALGQNTPGNIYQPSSRVWNGKLQPPEYSKEFIVRKVRPAGQISLKPYASDIFIGSALVGEHVGLKQVDDGIYEVYYSSIFLGKIDHTKKIVLPKNTKRKRSI